VIGHAPGHVSRRVGYGACGRSLVFHVRAKGERRRARCGWMGIERWRDDLPSVVWWQQGVAEERHRTGQEDGSRNKGEQVVSSRYAPFDVAEYLDNDEVIAEYLTAAMEDPNPDVFLAALGDVAKARGMAQIANEAGLGRESLYKALSSGAHPRYDTIKAVLGALGVKLSVVPNHLQR
jgi:probable addiction module antidote protein